MTQPDSSAPVPHACDDVLAAAARADAPIPFGEDGPVFAEPAFAEPWEAQAFALTVALHGRGLFAWSEWAQALSWAIRTSEAAGDGAGYYEHWLAALEALLAEKGLAAPDAVSARADAWRRAAEATPHGAPIRLENDPLHPR